MTLKIAIPAQISAQISAKIVAGALVASAFAIGEAQAAACVGIASVTASAVVADNVDYKGHVGAHVKDVGTTGRAASSVGRNVYNSTADFDTMWGKISADATDCPDNPGGNNTRTIVLSAEDAGEDAVSGYPCTAVDALEVSKCTTVGDAYVPTSYQFQFQYKNTAPTLAGSNWILNTAYPNP